MLKRNFELKWIPLLASFFLISLCMITFPKFGTTHNHTGSVTATATAEKTGQNWFYSTYKTHAEVVVESLPNDIGVYAMTVKVTGKKPPLLSGRTQRFSSCACAFTDDMESGKKYYQWGSGSGDFKISASSSGCINGRSTSASGSCTVNYPQQP